MVDNMFCFLSVGKFRCVLCVPNRLGKALHWFKISWKKGYLVIEVLTVLTPSHHDSGSNISKKLFYNCLNQRCIFKSKVEGEFDGRFINQTDLRMPSFDLNFFFQSSRTSDNCHFCQQKVKDFFFAFIVLSSVCPEISKITYGNL